MAAFVWDLLDGARGIDELTVAVCAQFDPDPSRARRDVVDLLDALYRRGLVRIASLTGEEEEWAVLGSNQ